MDTVKTEAFVETTAKLDDLKRNVESELDAI